MANRADITPDLCRQLLRYEPETGKLFWKPRPVIMFADSPYRGGIRTAEWACNAWNSKWAESEAFTASNGDGYRVGAICRVNFRAHRVAWAIVHGEWPADQIDHINGDRSDNRLDNLAPVTNAINHQNEGMPKNNTSGVAGVYWCKHTGKWRALVKVNYKSRCLGRYATIAEAQAARKAELDRLGFAEGHGQRRAWSPPKS